MTENDLFIYYNDINVSKYETWDLELWGGGVLNQYSEGRAGEGQEDDIDGNPTVFRSSIKSAI